MVVMVDVEFLCTPSGQLVADTASTVLDCLRIIVKVLVSILLQLLSQPLNFVIRASEKITQLDYAHLQIGIVL